MIKKTSIALATLAVLAAGSAALWWSGQPSDLPATRYSLPATSHSGIITTATNSHQPIASYSKTGDAIPVPSDPALADALSLDSRLDFRLRLKTIHALYGVVVTPEQAAFMRAYVADPAIPEGLNIRQVRALKNDVLNVLCAQPGEEEATAAMLRALHTDPTQDPGLRDYALQHLATLTEREPDLGWEAHWAAVEGNDPALAATALIHLAGLDRAGALGSSDRERLKAAALRLASDSSAKDPARTTAIQLCGRLGLTEARTLANDLARDARAGIPLRIAAIATLGDLGGDADAHAYLTALATGSERRLRVPADSALRRFALATNP